MADTAAAHCTSAYEIIPLTYSGVANKALSTATINGTVLHGTANSY